MKALIHLLIVVFGLAFAAGIMGCNGKPKEPEEPAEVEEPAVGEPVQEPDYVCEVCGEAFASTAELEEHSETHGPQ